MKTVILVDLDNLNSARAFEILLSFYTKETQFVFFGLRRVHKPTIARINDLFWFVSNKPDRVWLDKTVPDGSDMKLFQYVGQHMSEWDGQVENVIIVSGDKGVINLSLLLQPKFRTWIAIKDSCHDAMKKYRKDQLQLGLQVRYIRMKHC